MIGGRSVKHDHNVMYRHPVLDNIQPQWTIPGDVISRH